MARDETHFEGKVHQNAIVTTKDHEKILVSRDPRDETLFELPGGRLNVGERPVEGLRREIREELGIEIEVGGIYHTQYLWHEREQRENLLLMYIAYIPNYDIELHLDPTEIEEITWVTKDTYKDVPMFKDATESIEAFFKARL